MNGQPQPPQISRHGWYVITSLFVLGIGAALVYRCDERQRMRDAAEQYRQEEIDRPGIHELERSLRR